MKNTRRASLSLSFTLCIVACGSTHELGYGDPTTDAGDGSAGAGGSPPGTDAGGKGGSGGAGGSPTADAAPPPTGMPIHATQVAAGVWHACAILDDETVACWGSQKFGQLGDGASSGERLGAAVVPGLAGVTRLVIGNGSECESNGTCGFRETTCALLRDGTARCWGSGSYGQLGNGKQGTGYFESSPVAMNLGSISDLALGPNVGCAVTQSGTVSCWGANDRADLGFTSAMNCGPFYEPGGDGPPRLVPSPCEPAPRAVPGLSGAAHVAVGRYHQCAVHPDQKVSCWGENTFGELGIGVDSMNALPVAPTVLPNFAATQLALGFSHSCAVLPDLSVSCWGSTSAGQLGIGSQRIDDGRISPTPVPGLSNVRALAAFEDTTMALAADGTAHAWGDVNYVFPDPPVPGSAAVDVPTTMPWVSGATALVTASFQSCFLHLDHTVSCWGIMPEYVVRMQ